jgi:putative spermidine/putrescine transport system substrate-binding protein
MKNKVMRTALVAILSVAIPGAVSLAPSHATGTTLYTHAEWQKIQTSAKGQTVNFYMWGGGAKINDYVNKYLAPLAAQQGVTLNQVKLNGTPDAVNKVLAEKQAGNLTNGSVDMIWINGNNFATGVQANIWNCGWSTKLPNAKYVDWGNSSVANDFGLPVNGCEAPWATASSGLVYDSKVMTKTNVSSMANFVAWIKANPGKFTYPAPPDFNGSMTVRRLAYYANGGASSFLGAFNQTTFDSTMRVTADFLNGLKPYLWRQGKTYPADIGALQKLYATGEVSAYVNYGALSDWVNVKSGLFPATTKVSALDGMIGNISYITIPFNSPHFAGAQVVANLMHSPAAQLEMQAQGVIGSPAINMNMTTLSGSYRALPINPGGVSPAVLAKNALPEPNSNWVNAIDAGWAKLVQQK